MGRLINLFGGNDDSNKETPDTAEASTQDSSERPSWENVLDAMTNPKSKVHEAIDDNGNITYES